jgi:hypothetical protein
MDKKYNVLKIGSLYDKDIVSVFFPSHHLYRYSRRLPSAGEYEQGHPQQIY